MQYFITPDQLEQTSAPPAYLDFADTIWDLRARFDQNIQEFQWPPKLEAADAPDAIVPSQRVFYLEQYLLSGLSDWMRLNDWGTLYPSQTLISKASNAVAPIYTLYEPALKEAERLVDQALRQYGVARARLHVLQCMFSKPLSDPVHQLTAPPASAFLSNQMGTVNDNGVFLFAQSATTTTVAAVPVPPPAPVGSRVAADLRIQPGALVVTGLRNTRKLIDELLSPKPLDLEAFGDSSAELDSKSKTAKKSPLTIDESQQYVLADAVLADVNEVFGSALIKEAMGPGGGSAPKLQDPRQLFVALRDSLDAATVALRRALDLDLLYVIKVSLILTFVEQQDLLVSYQRQLKEVWDNLRDAYVYMVNTSATLDDLETALQLELGGRMEQTVSIFDAYRHSAPIYEPAGASSSTLIGSNPALKKMPTERDISLLIESDTGMQIVEISQVMRPILSGSSISKDTRVTKFFSELPKQMGPMLAARTMTAMTLLQQFGTGTTVLAQSIGRVDEPLNLIEIYFDTTPDSYGNVAFVDAALRGRYTLLRRQKQLDKDRAEDQKAADRQLRIDEQDRRERAQLDKEARQRQDRQAAEAQRQRERDQDRQDRLAAAALRAGGAGAAAGRR